MEVDSLGDIRKQSWFLEITSLYSKNVMFSMWSDLVSVCDRFIHMVRFIYMVIVVKVCVVVSHSSLCCLI